MKSIITIVLFLVLSSCGTNNDQKSKLKFFEAIQADLVPYINDKDMPASPDLSADRTIINNDYPIEIALYKDGKWYYDLANLDDGHGTWKFEDGVIKLHAERSLFDMYITVEAIEEGAKEVAIRFADRFGPRVLKMEKINIEN